jgi:hypothetical protein
MTVAAVLAVYAVRAGALGSRLVALTPAVVALALDRIQPM